MRRILAATALAALALAAGCGSKNKNPVTPTPTGAVHVSPATARILVHGSVSLSATVTDLASGDVTWRLTRQSPIPDTVDVGHLSVTGPHSVDYFAPDVVRGTFDYQIGVVAVSVSDTTAKAMAIVTVPRVTLTVTPGNLSSVPPGSLVPYAVVVANTPNPGFTLFVDGVASGNSTLGTWTQTGPSSAVYDAPSKTGLTLLHELFARSTDDPKRFGSATITVRRGQQIPPRSPGLSQFAPEWHPFAKQLAFVDGGPAFTLAIWDSATSQIRTVTSLTWSAATYTGRLSWSADGSRLAASEESGGRRVIAVVGADGTGRTTFSPDGTTNYWEADFWPPAEPGLPDSLVVAQSAAAGATLRVYPVDAAPGEQGRLLYTAPLGAEIRYPDAVRVGSLGAVVAFEEIAGGAGSVRSLVDDGSGQALTAASGAGLRSQVRWAENSDTGALWISFIWDVTQTAYRVNRNNPSSLQRLYTDFFPELSGDVGFALGKPPTALPDLHALSRVHPDGIARIWLVEFPDASFPGVSKPEELELASIGIRGALSPWRWRTWLGRL